MAPNLGYTQEENKGLNLIVSNKPFPSLFIVGWSISDKKMKIKGCSGGVRENVP